MGIEDCLKSKKDVFTFEDDFTFTFTDERDDEYHLLAEEISKDTGIKVNYIYSSIYNSYLSHWHKVDGEWYYFKCEGDYYHSIRELLGEVISNYFHLDSVPYKIGKKISNGKEEYGVVSKNFYDKNSRYKRIWDYGINLNKDLFLYDGLWMICSNMDNYHSLSSDLKKLMVRDFYSSEGDRMAYNFLIQEKNGEKRLAPLYDYSLSFEFVNPYYRSEIGVININDKKCVKKIKEDYTFQFLFNHLMEANMEEFLQEVEDCNQLLLSGDEWHYFTKYDKDMKKLIRSKKIIS